VELMGQVAQEGLNLVGAAAMLQLSYRKGEAYVATLSAGGQAGNDCTWHGPASSYR
jgi:hypothetical protein